MKRFNRTICAAAISAFFATTANASVNVELGKLSVDSNAQTVAISGFTNPVVIAGVPSIADDDPGAVSITNVSGSSFNIAFKEWNYLDGSHGAEDLPYMVLEKGRHIMADGSIWEVGTVNRNNGSGQVYFSQPFSNAPVVLLSGQTQNETDTYGVRAQSVTRHSFNVRLFEQEAGDAHATETIGYVAIYNPDMNGVADNGKRYSLATEVARLDQHITTFGTLLLDEEQSSDTETKHTNEVLGILEFDGMYFAEDNSLYGGDAMTLRYDATYEVVPGDKTGDSGNIALIGTNLLSDASYSASLTYTSDAPRAAFDGYVFGGVKVNNDGTAQLNRGTWISYGVPQWLQVDFGKKTMISGLAVKTSASYPARAPKDATLEVSDDGINFTAHESFNMAYGGGSVNLANPAIGQFFRLKVTSTHGDYYIQIGELEYYGDFINIVGPAPTPPSPTPYISCKAVLDANPGAQSGLHLLDPDETGPNAPFHAFCDMETNGGGWTRVGNFNSATDLGDFSEDPVQTTDATTIGWHVSFSQVEAREVLISGIQDTLPLQDKTLAHNIINTPVTTVVGTGQLHGDRIYFNTEVQSTCDGTINTFAPASIGNYSSDYVRMGAYFEGQRLSGSLCYDWFSYGDAWGRKDARLIGDHYNYGLYKNWQEGVWVR